MSELNEQMIELTIEALTGTVYDLCVSPFETILGIKMKIQRLEGIPVYQQHLVHGNTELHDEFCLEEYSIGSGAQLKLLLAMRGGPIHAHRVQLEDPAILEIAEVLEGHDFDQKYTVMLLRDGDALEMADLVEVGAEESPGHVSPLPQTAATADQETTSAVALSKVTRTKMQELMSRLRSRKPPSQAETDGSQLQRRGTAKVLILDSRSSSRLLHSPAPSPMTPHTTATPTTAKNPSTVHRKLVFPAVTAEEGTQQNHKAAESCEGGARRSLHSRPPPPRPAPAAQALADHVERQWRRRRRLRRPSCFPEKPAKHSHWEVGELARGLAQLGLRDRKTDRRGERTSHKTAAASDPLLPQIPSTTTSSTSTTFPSLPGVPRLPEIPAGHAPSLMGGGGQGRGRPQCTLCGKKTRLASTYTCRCGRAFCSLHRYAETHHCPFDYKTQGRETIARGNPLVVAPKLPKI